MRGRRPPRPQAPQFLKEEMAKLAEILEAEKERKSAEQERTIQLWPDGKFYRAYEWSAWLCVRYVHQFKVTRRAIKKLDADMLFVGFPQSSLDKFCIEGTHVEPLVDGRVNLILPGELVKPDNSEESLETEFHLQSSGKYKCVLGIPFNLLTKSALVNE